jgi:MFS family permease
MSQTPLWRNRNFRLVFGASVFSHLGTGVYGVAFPWFATLLTRDPLLIGLVAMAPQLPWVIFALPAGVWTDRLDHRATIVWANMAMAALALAVVGLALWAAPGLAAVLALAGLAFLTGSVEVLRDNTAQTILPDVVEPADLEEANAALQSSEKLTGQFIGPPLSGALIAGSIAVPFGFHAVMLILSAAFLARTRVRPRALKATTAFWPALREGLGWLWAHLVLRRLGLVLGLFNFLYEVIWSVMVLYAQDSLHLTAAGYGALLSVLALGGLLGGLSSAWLLKKLGARRGLLVSIFGFCLATSVLIFTETPWIAGLALFAEAFTGMLWNVVTVSYRQRHIPAPLLGRVNAAYRFLGWGPRPFGSFLGGALVAMGAPLGAFAPHLPFAFATLGGVLLLAYCARSLHLD